MIHSVLRKIDRQLERQTGRQTYTQKDRQTDRQIDDRNMYKVKIYMFVQGTQKTSGREPAISDQY